MGIYTPVKSNVVREAETSYVQVIIGILLAAAYVFAPDVAWAQSAGGGAASISGVMTKVGEGANSLPRFVHFIAYIMGIALIAVGLFNAKNHIEKPDSLLKIFGPLAIGGMMIALPATWDMITTSLYTSEDTSADQLKARAAEAGTIGGVIVNFRKATFGGGSHGLFDLIDYICYVIGIMLIFSGLRNAYAASQGGGNAPKVSGIAWRMIGGGFLSTLPYATQIVRNSLFPSASAVHDIASIGQTDTGSLITLLANAVKNVHDPVLDMTFLVCFLIGIILIAQTIYAMAGIGVEQQKISQGQMVTRLIVGGLLMSSWSFYQAVNALISGGTSTAAPTTFDTLMVRNGAANDTIGGAINNMRKSAFGEKQGLFTLIGYCCTVVGILLIGSSLKGAHKIATGANGAPQPSGIIWRAIGGALLAALPYATQIVRKSIFGTGATGRNNFQETAEMVTNSAQGAGLDAALIRLVSNVREPIIDLTFIVAFLVGLIIIAQTLYAMSGINFEQQKVTPGQMVTRFIFGGLLMSSWSVYQAVYLSIYGGTSVPDFQPYVLAYDGAAQMAAADAERANNLLKACLAWVQIIGVIAFFRGWFTLKTSLDGGQATKSAGITQVVAGALCINMPATLIMIGNTLGITMITR